jgi:hypothetical protein
MKDPFRNVNYVEKDRVVIRDTMGNCYEIESIEGLDRQSRKEVARVL